MTIQEVAERLGVAPRTVNKYIKEGRFPGAYRLNPRLWMIPESDLEGFERPKMGRPAEKTESDGQE